MDPVERIEAAIAKLEALKASGTPGAWRFNAGEFGDITTQQDPTVVVEAFVAENLDGPDGHLIVTLHRTIDAQLAILRAERDSRLPIHDYPTGMVLALADAILGSD